MTDHIADLKASVKRHTGTMGPACMTCAFFNVDRRRDAAFGLCGVSMTYMTVERAMRDDPGSCGPEGKWWEARSARPPRLGLIPWLRRLLWGG